MSICYYGDKISENIAKTPEGFLICKGVPIARTGYQTYLSDEIYRDGDTMTKIDVYRSPDEVFARETLASFEGKPVTNDHPAEDVTTENFKKYALGHVQNVRKGGGNDGDKIIADLYVTDPKLIKLIQGGKRQISAGYCAIDERRGGRVCQTRIRGNHVAVVDEGRAGRSVSIRDSKHRKGDVAMDKKKGIARILMRYIRDASPDELEGRVEEVVDALSCDSVGVFDETAIEEMKKDECAEEKQDESPAEEKQDESPAEEKQDESPAFEPANDDLKALVSSLSEKLDRLGELIEGLVKHGVADEMPADDKKDDESEIVETDEESEDDSKKANDAAIRQISKEVMTIKDPAERKRIQDAIIRATSKGESQMKGVIELTQKAKAQRDNACKNISIEAMQQAYDALNPHKTR